jgi:hypothetical protein
MIRALVVEWTNQLRQIPAQETAAWVCDLDEDTVLPVTQFFARQGFDFTMRGERTRPTGQPGVSRPQSLHRNQSRSGARTVA